MTTGEKLVSLRGEKSQQTMAEEIGITKSALAMYERNERIPRDQVKVKIAEHFNVTVQALFYDEKPIVVAG